MTGAGRGIGAALAKGLAREGAAVVVNYSRAAAEAAKSLAVFQQNPALANFQFRLDALDSSLKERSILIFDQHTPPFDLFLGASTNLLNLLNKKP